MSQIAIGNRSAPPQAVEEPAACECGAAWRYDPLREGETCGGVYRVGWLVCDSCGATCVTRRGTVQEPWRLTSSGRSVDAGACRLRADGEAGDVMRRIVRLPELEALARAVARGEAVSPAQARAALGAP